MMNTEQVLSKSHRLFCEPSEDDPDILEVWMDGEVLSSIHIEDLGGWKGQNLLQVLIEKINLGL
jgi:hypothetical protein